MHEISGWASVAPAFVLAAAIFGLGNAMSKVLRLGTPSKSRSNAAAALEIAATAGVGWAGVVAVITWANQEPSDEISGRSLVLMCIFYVIALVVPPAAAIALTDKPGDELKGPAKPGPSKFARRVLVGIIAICLAAIVASALIVFGLYSTADEVRVSAGLAGSAAATLVAYIWIRRMLKEVSPAPTDQLIILSLLLLSSIPLALKVTVGQSWKVDVASYALAAIITVISIGRIEGATRRRKSSPVNQDQLVPAPDLGPA